MTTQIRQHKQAEQGFTLVELSIVLVIIGLIVGGILVGQDMIKAAEIRSTVSQISALNSAMNTFRDKYRYLPGDVSAAAATAAGLATRTGAVGRGDGNSLLEGSAAGATIVSGETALVWADLNQVGMLDGRYTGTDAAAAAATPDAVKAFLPEAKLGRGNYITAYASQGINFYQLAGVTVLTAGAPTLVAALTPQEALNIDQKTDDGVPLTGSTRAMLGTAASAATNFNTTATVAASLAATTPGVCLNEVVAASGGQYATKAGSAAGATAEANANTPACGLRLRFN